LDRPRENGRGGGVALLCKESLKPKTLSVSNFDSFEVMSVKLNLNVPVIVSILYRPPSGDFTVFIKEFGELLANLSLNPTPLIIMGDFNINLKSPSSKAQKFLDLINMFSLSQHVTSPTHNLGGILDLVISSDDLVDCVNICDQSAAVSDHYLLSFPVKKFSKPGAQVSPGSIVQCRDIARINYDQFKFDLTGSLSKITEDPTSEPNYMIDVINDVLISCLDKHAPLKSRRVTLRTINSRFNTELLKVKKKRRVCERKLRKATGDNVHVMEIEYRRVTNEYLYELRLWRQSQSLQIVEQAKCKPRALFNLFSISECRNNTKSDLKAEELSDFFVTKIDNIRASITLNSDFVFEELTEVPQLSHFNLCTEQEVLKLMSTSRKTNNSSDICPTSVVIECLPMLLPYLTRAFNCSLISGVVPGAFKNAMVRPILKKENGNPNDFSNYRPISLLPFLSKILEKIVAERLVTHMITNDLDEVLQSGFKASHSSETALLKVTDDLRRASDNGRVSILTLLDLSAAFDTIDHSFLINRLSTDLGISGKALSWLQSYVENRFQSVTFNGSTSNPKPVKYGVPQGSVLGPLLFRIYLLPLGKILKKEGFDFHLYADDTQIYLSSLPTEINTSIEKLKKGFELISTWLSKNFLKLNTEKTNILLIGPKEKRERLSKELGNITLGSVPIALSDRAKNLGVIFDGDLSLSSHVASVTKSAIISFKNMAKIRKHFSFQSFEILTHAFVTSRLDYCNSLLTGANHSDLNKLQLVQNYSAKILCNRKKYDSVTPLLKGLHWLPIRERVVFKAMVMSYKAIKNQAPSYISNMVTKYAPGRYLRSSTSELLKVPRANTRGFGDRAFSIFAPRQWNNLPASIKESSSLDVFKKRLKTHLFVDAYKRILQTEMSALSDTCAKKALYKHFYYLLFY
jgi:hypothetical protein